MPIFAIQTSDNRFAHHYLDRDFQPGPYPKTKEEREAAAKKYNLLPEEYEAYDPEIYDQGFGDYPKLPNITYNMKDPYYAWQYMPNYADYNHPIHIFSRNMGFERINLGDYDENIPLLDTFIMWVGLISWVCFAVYFVPTVLPTNTTFKPKHYPQNGPHYFYPNNELTKHY